MIGYTFLSSSDIIYLRSGCIERYLFCVFLLLLSVLISFRLDLILLS